MLISTRALRLAAVVAAFAAALTGFLSVNDARASTPRLAVADAHLVNYYPASHGWTAMWSGWDGAEFDRDMARLSTLHANAVRLIVQPSAFGYPTPAKTMTDRLAAAVDIAGRHGLAVELTLFDWFSSYDDVRGSQAWATAVLAPFKDDSRVFAVELQNELPVENAHAVAWSRTMLPYLASLTRIPTTVSVTGKASRLATLKAQLGGVQPTFWSYHYYDQVEGAGAYSAFAAAKAIAAPLPLYIGETGVDTNPRAGETAATAEARQDHFYRAVFTAAAAQGLPVPAPWILSDFTPGSLSKTTSPAQYDFGLVRTDGSSKPAAVTVREAFLGHAPATSFNGSFESSATLPAEWTQYLPAQTSIAVDHAVAHTGTSSVRFTRSGGDASGWPSLYTAPVQTLVAGRSYTATAWAKGAELTGTNRLGLTWYDADGHYLGVAASASVRLGTSDWQQLTATGTPPAGAAMVLVQLQTTRNTGAVWFDDVTFG